MEKLGWRFFDGSFISERAASWYAAKIRSVAP